MSASGRGRSIFAWVRAPEDMSSDIEDLAECGDLESLDVKLSRAINRIKKGTRVKRKITTLIEAAAARGEMVSGRQLLRVIYQQFEIDQAACGVYDISNLHALSYPGDEHLESFVDVWDEIISRLSRDPGEDVLREILSAMLRIM